MDRPIILCGQQKNVNLIQINGHCTNLKYTFNQNTYCTKETSNINKSDQVCVVPF